MYHVSILWHLQNGYMFFSSGVNCQYLFKNPFVASIPTRHTDPSPYSMGSKPSEVSKPFSWWFPMCSMEFLLIMGVKWPHATSKIRWLFHNNLRLVNSLISDWFQSDKKQTKKNTHPLIQDHPGVKDTWDTAHLFKMYREKMPNRTIHPSFFFSRKTLSHRSWSKDFGQQKKSRIIPRRTNSQIVGLWK